MRAFDKLNDTFSMLASRPQDVLAANLRRLRIARRLSLSELARATGMSKATLSSVESGRSNPTVETLAALAAALRVSLGELLEEPPLGEVRVVRRGRQANSIASTRPGSSWPSARGDLVSSTSRSRRRPGRAPASTCSRAS